MIGADRQHHAAPDMVTGKLSTRRSGPKPRSAMCASAPPSQRTYIFRVRIGIRVRGSLYVSVEPVLHCSVDILKGSESVRKEETGSMLQFSCGAKGHRCL